MDDRHVVGERLDQPDDPDRTEIALLDHRGVIVEVNEAWNEFWRANGGGETNAGVGTSYLETCDRADDPDATAVGAAIRAVLSGDTASMATLRFRCDAPTDERWFEIMVSARPLPGQPAGATVAVTPLHPRHRLDTSPRATATAERPSSPCSDYLDAISRVLDDLADRESVTHADAEDPLVAGLVELSRTLLRRYERLSVVNGLRQQPLGPLEHLTWLRRQAEQGRAESESAQSERPG